MNYGFDSPFVCCTMRGQNFELSKGPFLDLIAMHRGPEPAISCHHDIKARWRNRWPKQTTLTAP